MKRKRSVKGIFAWHCRQIFLCSIQTVAISSVEDVKMVLWLFQQGKTLENGSPKTMVALWCARGQNWWTFCFWAFHNNRVENQGWTHTPRYLAEQRNLLPFPDSAPLRTTEICFASEFALLWIGSSCCQISIRSPAIKNFLIAVHWALNGTWKANEVALQEGIVLIRRPEKPQSPGVVRLI